MIISIFCKIIDNFGDIGVCWRLVKKLAHTLHHHSKYAHIYCVNLYIDNLPVLYKIIDIEYINNYNIKIHAWHKDTHTHTHTDVISYDNADYVINAFACHLPELYQTHMPKDICWIQLDYLATETWANSYHGLYAMIGIHKRYFFTPGFTRDTAGLLTKDFNLITQKNTTNNISYDIKKIKQPAIRMFIFAYITPSILQHLRILYDIHLSSTYTIEFFMPKSVYESLYNAVIDNNNNDLLNFCNMVQVCEFCTQNNFDALLQMFDILWVRGEDSFIRAQLCAKPMLWQAYIQNKDVQLDKINGFLMHYLPYFSSIQQEIIKKLYMCINTTLNAQDINTEVDNTEYNILKNDITKLYLDFFELLNSKHINIYQNSLNKWQKYIYELPDMATEILTKNVHYISERPLK